MNSRLFYTIALMLSVILAATSCGNKNNNEHRINPKIEEIDNTPDNSLHVRLLKVANDSIYVKGIGTSSKPAYGISDALAAGKVMGSLTPGDELCILPENKNKRVTVCVNTSELRGRWFYDMKHHRGFTFGERGALSTINTDDISFREWKLLNGKLYVYYVDMQYDAIDRHEYEVEEAELLHLTKETLDFHFRGKQYSCKREHKVLKFGEQ